MISTGQRQGLTVGRERYVIDPPIRNERFTVRYNRSEYPTRQQPGQAFQGSHAALAANSFPSGEKGQGSCKMVQVKKKAWRALPMANSQIRMAPSMAREARAWPSREKGQRCNYLRMTGQDFSLFTRNRIKQFDCPVCVDFFGPFVGKHS